MNSITEIIANNPLASIGLVSLLIPILIHLFNPNRGKIVLIGNLYLIEKVKNKKVTEVKIRQWLLLVTRLLFLTLLTLLLIELLFPKKLTTKQQESIFVSTAWLEHASEEEKNRLMAQRPEKTIYLMRPGFEEIKKNQHLVSNTANQFSLDSLINEAYAKQLLTSNNQIYFDPNTDFLAEDRPLLHLANLANFSFQWIELKPQPRQSISNLEITVFYSSDRIADFEQLKPALDLITQTNSRLELSYHLIPSNIEQLILDKSKSDSPKNSATNLYFWLSSIALPQDLLQEIKQGNILISDSQSTPLNSKLTNINFSELDFNLYHSLPKLTEVESIPVWPSHHGTLLSYKPFGEGRLIQFHTRLNKNWTNLTDGTVMLDLVDKLLAVSVTDQQNPILNSTLYDQNHFSLNPKKQTSIGYQSYRNFLILILTLVWLLERILSESKAYRHD